MNVLKPFLQRVRQIFYIILYKIFCFFNRLNDDRVLFLSASRASLTGNFKFVYDEIKKTLAVLVTLFTTFRPSITTCGRLVKSESSSTTCATWRLASLPSATAMEQSASRSARRSLTPSPVMATWCPCRFSAHTSSFFCPGVTLANTAYCWQICS